MKLWRWIVLLSIVLVVSAVVWQLGPDSVISAIGGGICAVMGWLFGRKKKPADQSELNEAIDRGVASVAAADKAAKEEVDRVVSNHDLSSYLLERDPGPDDERDP